ncbi:MAG: UDP-4-amino-4,6-dideoxy-N-acetyl-beta-L-altrosamine N-acetyltransferase [Bacilli bacterium]|uniref:UDP-4-amino-4, 6-dideoxy-N-acetyl-beta-L-altrosamine N-acetyltransferase n=1 Tax=Anaerorhabdus sp. TaxID=1872524 RepID=UPI002FCA0488
MTREMIVRIRPLKLEDTKNIVCWRNKKFVLENFIDRRSITDEDHIQYFVSKIEKGFVRQFIINANEVDIGTVFLRDIDGANRKAEFGIFIGEEAYLGKGIGKLVIKQILEYAFNELDLNKVFLRVLSENKRAIASYENSGFKFEGCFRQDVFVEGKFLDIVFMSVLKEEW